MIKEISLVEGTEVVNKLHNRDNDKNRYKMWKIPDSGEKARLVIVDGDRFIINKNPTKEELKYAIKWTFEHNSTETCYRCGESFNKISGYPCKEKDKDGRWIGIWDCANCRNKYDPNSDTSKRKLDADCRNNNLDPDSNAGRGYIAAVLIKKRLKIEDCFNISDNFNNHGYDLIEHEDWGLIDVKGSSLFMRDTGLYHSFHINKNKKADFFFCIGFDKDRKHAIVVYIIPNEKDVSKLCTINIPYNRCSKYNKYKESEEDIKKWDDLFHTLKLDNCLVLRRNKNMSKIEEYDKD